jgi:pimeloyl-ACP methyl ester carboxylesterase
MHEEQVQFRSGPITLVGTLTLPTHSAGERRPAVVLIHGSGPHGRDQLLPLSFPKAQGLSVNVFGNLADALGEAGYVVLRYDKRTCGNFNKRCDNDYPMPEHPRVTDFEDDAAAALDWLKDRAEVAPDRLVVIGHSQGGAFVPRLLDRRSDLVAGVMLAGPYRGIDVLLAWQAALQREMMAELGMEGAVIDQALAGVEQMARDVSALREGTYTGDAMSEDVQSFWTQWLELGDGLPAVARRVRQPILAISGDYDFNVAPEDTQSWSALFAEVTPNPGHRAVVQPGLTHALNLVHRRPWFDVEATDVETEVSRALIDEVLDFLSVACAPP